MGAMSVSESTWQMIVLDICWLVFYAIGVYVTRSWVWRATWLIGIAIYAVVLACDLGLLR